MFLSTNKLLEVALGFSKPHSVILDLAVNTCSNIILGIFRQMPFRLGVPLSSLTTF